MAHEGGHVERSTGRRFSIQKRRPVDLGRTLGGHVGGGPAASLKGGTAVTLLKPMELNQTDHLETSDDAKILKMVKDYNQI